MSKTPPSSARGQSGSPHTETLIKNLRLLDFDEELDWPHVRANAFAATSTVKEQKDRVRCAQWILYKLFERWDPKDTAENLSELFPALEPKQSKNLRALLFKRLSELKNSGVFHRDIVVRRTMFDDCKGPKFEELLSAFSTIVLHKVLSADSKDGSISKKIILRKTTCDSRQLSVLYLAYQFSFTKTLRLRESYEKRWQKFGRTLRSQKDELETRQKAVDESIAKRKEKKIPQRTLDRLRRHMVSNWKGDADWVDILLRSDKHRPQKRILERPFNEVWQHASEDMLYAMRPEKNDSLLHVMEIRVASQNSRLEKWRSIRERLTIQAQAMELHEDAASNGTLHASESGQTPGEWTSTDSTASSAQHDRSMSWNRQMDPESPLMYNKGRLSPTKAIPPDLTNNDAGYDIRDHARGISPSRKDYSNGRPALFESRQHEMPPPSQRSPQGSPARRLHETLLEEEEPEPLGAEQAMAAQILSSVMNAEPSPLRPPKPSLEDRARMSLARTSPQKAEFDLLAEPRTTQQQQQQQQPPEKGRPPAPATPERIQTLAERTRQSMSLMSARPSRRRSRVSRVSNIYPTNQFETPRRPGPSTAAAAETPLFDESMENLDAESVFKSRPRIAMSPIPQATPHPLGIIDDTLTLDED